MSLSQHGQSSAPAARFVMEAQSSMAAAAILSAPLIVSAAVFDITTPIPFAPPAHAAEIGARVSATAMSAERMARSMCNVGTS